MEEGGSKGRVWLREEDVMTDAEVQTMQLPERGSEPRNKVRLYQLEKVKKWILSSSLKNGHNLGKTLILID